MYVCIPIGQEDLPPQVRSMSYPDTDVTTMCFSCDDRYSLDTVFEKWAPEVYHFCPNGNDISLLSIAEFLQDV